MSDKAFMTDEELELTQKIQRQFPRGVHPSAIKELNDCPKEIFGPRLRGFIQNRGQMQVVTMSGIAAPKGGIVQMLTVPANEVRTWQEAIDATGPNTPKDYNIWKVGDQYPPVAGAVEWLEEIFIVNFGKDSVTPSNAALAWGKSQHLTPASPRACFSVAECYPKLNTYLGMNSMAVVSLQTCSFEGKQHCCNVWFGGSGRRAGLFWLERGWLGGRCWFAFVRELGPGTLGS